VPHQRQQGVERAAAELDRNIRVEQLALRGQQAKTAKTIFGGRRRFPGARNLQVGSVTARLTSRPRTRGRLKRDFRTFKDRPNDLNDSSG